MSKTFNIEIARGGLQCRDCKKSWCDHLDEAVSEGVDASLLHPGITLDVPVFPSRDIYIQMRLGDKIDGMEAAPITVSYTADIGGTRSIKLGLWVKGDGIRVIRGIVLDFVRSQCDPADFSKPFSSVAGSNLASLRTKCPYRNHFASVATLKNIEATATERWLYLWSIVWERACPVCIQGTSDSIGEATDSLSELSTFSPRMPTGAGRRTPAPKAPAPVGKPKAWTPSDDGLGEVPF